MAEVIVVSPRPSSQIVAKARHLHSTRHERRRIAGTGTSLVPAAALCGGLLRLPRKIPLSRDEPVPTAGWPACAANPHTSDRRVWSRRCPGRCAADARAIAPVRATTRAGWHLDNLRRVWSLPERSNDAHWFRILKRVATGQQHRHGRVAE